MAFAGLRETKDGGNYSHQADQSSAAAAVNFVGTEILALSAGTFAAWLHDASALASYRQTLDNLTALGPHMFSARTGRLLASLSEGRGAPYTIYNRAKTGDMAFARFANTGGTSHAPEDMVVFVPKLGVLFSGDLFFRGRIPFVGQAVGRSSAATCNFAFVRSGTLLQIMCFKSAFRLLSKVGLQTVTR